MLKINNYFYFFAKLFTSLVLFFFLIIMGYALYSSYIDIDNDAVNLQKEFSLIKNSININKANLLKMNNIILQNKNISDSILRELPKNKENKKILQIINDNQALRDSIASIEEDVNKLSQQINSKTIEQQLNENLNNESIQIKELKKLIIIKYQNGEIINNEIILLEQLGKKTPNSVFEKIYTLNSKIFLGQTDLKKDFNMSIEKYVKNFFLENNQSIVIKFLLKYINIRPSNLSVYENGDLNILLRAKQLFEAESYTDSLTQILLLKDSNKYFTKFINQLNLYIEFEKLIEQVS